MASFEDDHAYMMPAHFGGAPVEPTPTIYDDTTALTVFYESDAAGLERLLPPGFTLSRPEVMVSMMENRGVRWMGGEPYDIVAVNVAARFEGEKDSIDGWYCLVVWENKATPILPGREQTGIPKIYGEVERIRFSEGEARTWAHYGGHSFCDVHVTSLREANEAETAMVEGGFASMDWIGYRFIPRTGGGGAEIGQPILFPQEFEARRVRVGQGEVVWTPPPMHKNPTQAHIIGALAGLPVGEATRPAIVMDAKAILRGDRARLLR